MRFLGKHTSKKDQQPPAPQPAAPSANEGVLNSRASPKPTKPTRSSTFDGTFVTPAVQEVRPQQTSEQVTTATTAAPPLAQPPPLIPTSAAASAPAPAPAPAPASAPVPEPVAAPAPAPPSVPAPPALAREKRTGTPKPDPQAEEIQRLQERCRYLESSSYRQELLSIRNHLQVNDLQEPWQVSQKFQAINKKVENVSRNISEYLADRFTPTVSLKTSDFIASSQNRPSKTDRDPLVQAEDFVDFRCRSLINDELMHTLFYEKMFHPVLASESELDGLLSSMYKNVQSQESQVIAGRWRVSSFNAFKHLVFPAEKVAFDFCQKTLLEFCRKVYGDKPAEEALNKFFPEVAGVFEYAWSWYSSAKSSLVLLDFQPYHFFESSPFEPEFASLEGRKLKPPSSGTILLTTRLGLMSMEAIGGGSPPQQAIQAQATVLTTEFFLSDR
ncbi:hypothetical protein FRC07_008759 [Ceratobasidium sp. 392]|nr:hypothetical protein FRC07_008759 [Ceratobasidium sp. 392]